MPVDYLVWSHQPANIYRGSCDCYLDRYGNEYKTAQEAVDYILEQQNSRIRESEPWFDSFEQAADQAMEWSDSESIAHFVVSCEVDSGRVIAEERTEIISRAAIRDELMREAGFNPGDNLSLMFSAEIYCGVGGFSVDLPLDNERNVSIVRRMLQVLKEFAESGS